MDVGEWLRQQGLGRHEAAFRDNAIDFDVLAELTDADLAGIGVPLGDRKRLLKAIAARGQSGAAPKSEAAASEWDRAAELTAPAAAAERRPVAVMFCDLVGSTSLAAKLDAEDWRDLVGAWLDAASAAVESFGGHVLKKLGDGLMALFGYPRAQENDAERAARAALAILSALEALNARNAGKGLPALAARIGLESGPVVVDAEGEVFGEAPNVAARVQGAAEPGTVLVTAAVQRQIAGRFIAEEKGAHALKGVPQPVALYRIVRASGGGRRGGARSLTPFVGREEDLALLLRRWERARGGEGQFVQIVGEPGLGKSRLMDEFRARIGATPHTWAEWSSSQLLHNTPLHPLAEWGRLRFGGADVAAEKRLAELESALKQVKLDPAEHAPLLAPVLDIPVPESRAPKLAPEELRRRQLAALTAWVLAGARSQPVVLAVEDLHWADPTSLDLMKTLAERGATAPLFILATARPEFRAPWATRSHHGVVSLVPLDRGEIRQMVGLIAERHAFSQESVEGVADRTGGVPLFVEEVTRLLLEGGAQTIPPTLQQSLAARLDRLGEAREVAQIGAVLGREFSHALLRSVAAVAPVAAVDDRGAALSERGYRAGDLSEAALQAALDRLVEADLVFVEGVVPEATYRFKHALIQDAAYESLLKSRRQALHRRAAEALLAAPDHEPELVAHHFTQAGQTEPAIEWWGKAGDAALRRSAFQEAIAHLGKAIEMADRTGGAPSRQKEAGRVPATMSKLHIDFAQAVMASKGHAAEETKAAYALVSDLAAASGNAAERFAAYSGRIAGSFMRGEFRLAQEIAETFLKEAEAGGHPTETGVARRLLGGARFEQGNFREAKTYLEEALSNYVASRDADARFRFGDTFSGSAGLLGVTLWHLGDVTRARELVDKAIRHATELGHIPSIVSARLTETMLEIRREDAAALLSAAEVLLGLARDHGMAYFAAFAEICSAWARGRLHDPRTRAAELRDALTRYAKTGSKAGAPYWHGFLAQLEAAAQDLGSALAEIEQGLSSASQTGEFLADSFLHRIRGDILLKRDPTDPAPAEQAYQAAIAVAQRQGARSYELLASLALAKLYQSAGRPAEAHAVLAPALESFAPTPEMPEIAEAQALLAALGETDAVKAEAARREQRTQLELNLATALLQGRGMQAPETRAAFERAGGIAAAAGDSMERLAILYGQWAGELARGDVRRMQEIAAAMEPVATREPSGQGALIARRVLGLTQFFAGDLMGADQNMQWTVDHYDFDRDHGLAVRFAHDQGAAARYYLAFTKWLIGDMDAAWRLIGEAKSLAERVGHPPTSVGAYAIAAWLDCVRGDHARARANAETAVALARDFDLPLWRSTAGWALAWATAASEGTRPAWDAAEAALAAVLRHGAGLSEPSAAYVAAGYAGLGDVDRALALVDRALSGPVERGLRVFLPEAHRVRGEILMKRDPHDPAPAEEALRTAVALAREQGSRAFGLRAALCLARLYQSTGRAVEAHVVLSDALEGFLPSPSGRRAGDEGPVQDADSPQALTPDPSPGRERRDTAKFPEIAEAQALLAALAASEPVAASLKKRETRAKLHAGYALATMMTKGFGADDTKAALARAASVSGAARTPEYWTIFYGRISADMMRGDHRAARAGVEAFLEEAEAASLTGHAAFARRMRGFLQFLAGDLVGARADLERALADFDEGHDGTVRTVFALDFRSNALAFLGLVSWYLGHPDEAERLTEEAIRRAKDSGQPGSHAIALFNRLAIGTACGRAGDVLPAAEELRALAEEHDLKFWRVIASTYADWARVRLGEPRADAFRAGLGAYADLGATMQEAVVLPLLAEVELAAGGRDETLAAVERGLKLAAETDVGLVRPWLLRLRGDALAQTDLAGAASAYREALSVAAAQGARASALMAALALARLLQSAGEAAEAHASLSRALEGFAPTSLFPAIPEAQALLARLAPPGS